MMSLPYIPPSVVPVSDLSDLDMIGLAASRTRVRLDDGRSATLIRWVTPRRPSQIRVQFLSGSFLTVHKRRVVEVFMEHHRPNAGGVA